MKTSRLILTALVLGLLFAPVPSMAQEESFNKLAPEQQLSEDILRELVSYESSEDHPTLIKGALLAMEKRLLAAGFLGDDVLLLNPSPNTYGLVVRYRGIGEMRPMLVLAHVDVVQAVPSHWSFPPFVLGKRDGYYFGRGTEDNKSGVAQIISNFISLKRENWIPGRDIIGVISGDEETTGDFTKWLVRDGSALVEAEFAINTDAGGGEYKEQGKHRAFWIQTSEKLYQTYRLIARNKGGHSSVPRPDNAIRDLSVAITRLANHHFPVTLSNSTQTAMRRSAGLYPDEVARDLMAMAVGKYDDATVERLAAYDPYFNAMMRTTCVPTQLSGGHAENALPREASVIVNCRIMPGTKALEIEHVIAGLIDGLEVEIEIVWDGIASDVSEIPDAMMEQIETLAESYFGNVPVIPSMSTGATDGLFFRNAGTPVYGISGLFSKPGESGAHGLDEKIGVREFHESVKFLNQVLKTLAD